MHRVLLLGSIAVTLGATGLAGQAQPEASATTSRTVSARPSALVGFVDGRLVRVDPATLGPVPGRGIAVGSGGCAPRSGGTACWSNPPWTVSANGTRLVVARNDVSRLNVVDVGRMRVASTLRWGFDGGPIGALAWLAPGRVLAVQEAYGGRQRLVAFDLAKKRIAARRTLGGTVVQLGRTTRELVLLLAPGQTVGQARIAVADARGSVRFARLEQIVVGSKVLGTGSDHRVDFRTPGLAVDPDGRRAFVVAQNVAAEIDLRTLAVSYHSLERPPSLLGRLWNWLEPVASAKQVSGYHRQARWLGAGSIAVSGSDTEDGRYEPAGLHLLDTGSWRLRTLDREATSFVATEGLLLATGWRWDASAQNNVGIGVAAYAADGTKRFQLFDGDHAWLAQVYDGRAYVGLASAQDRLRVVDLSSGTVTGVRNPALPSLLLDAGSGWWD